MVRRLRIVIRYNRVGRRRAARFVDRWTAARATAALYQSEYIRSKALIELPILGELRSFVIPNGYDVNEISVPEAQAPNGAPRTASSPGDLVVISVGFAEAEKRFDLSVDAMRAARESWDRSDLRLLRRRSMPSIAGRTRARRRGKSDVARRSEPARHTHRDRGCQCARASVTGRDLRKRAGGGDGARNADRCPPCGRQRRNAGRRWDARRFSSMGRPSRSRTRSGSLRERPERRASSVRCRAREAHRRVSARRA